MKLSPATNDGINRVFVLQHLITTTKMMKMIANKRKGKGTTTCLVYFC